MKNATIKNIVTSLAFVGGCVFTNSVIAQTPGVWNGSSTPTLTSDAVGVGTVTPDAYIEVEYCDDQQKGIIITKKDCGFYVLAPDDIPISYDGVLGPVIPVEGDGGGGGPVVFTTPIPFFLTPYQSFMAKPMLWARTENISLFRPQASGQHTTQFIVTPYGRTGINIENPRATLDVKGLGGRNIPAAIIGRQKPGTVDRTQHVHFVPWLGENGYNQITQADDQGIFFTDGMGNDGANVNGALVLAPWAQSGNPSVGGLRIDNMGNLQVHGEVKATKMNLAVQWWSDFVFCEDYKLMPLQELKKFVEEHKHLPSIPSEAELLDAGLDVAQMQALHMQKIEELTLYILEQEKRMDTQSQEIATLIEANQAQNIQIQKQDEQLKKQQEDIDLLKKQVAQLLKN